ncbi:MAG: hypothetical protein K8S54_02265 [Spirochaetia bacterium]|nr:hypothetical protein [Spirochaetia bacterium]
MTEIGEAILKRIADLDKIKLQRLIHWLSAKELMALVTAADPVLEDSILENLSAHGRGILLENLGSSEVEFAKRAGVRRKINELYQSALGLCAVAPNKSERLKILESIKASLPPGEQLTYATRFKMQSDQFDEGILIGLTGYLDQLDRGMGLPGQK